MCTSFLLCVIRGREGKCKRKSRHCTGHGEMRRLHRAFWNVDIIKIRDSFKRNHAKRSNWTLCYSISLSKFVLPQLLKKIHTFTDINDNHHVYTIPQLMTSLSHLKSNNSFRICFYEMQSNTIIPSTTSSPKQSIHWRILKPAFFKNFWFTFGATHILIVIPMLYNNSIQLVFMNMQP
jgi:hypothetical protein